MIAMLKNNATKAVTAALAAALTAGVSVAPALAFPAPEAPAGDVAIVAQSVGSDDAINAAVDASPLYWADVAGVDWYYDCVRDDYVVTLTAFTGAQWVVWVDAATGVAYAIF